jgi:cell division septation protein DedD
MKNTNFREIQVSSSLLVVIFLGVLALGVFIFLLGVSVGKKQVRLSAPTQVVTQQIPDPVKETPVKPTPAETESAKATAPLGAGASQPPAGGLASKTSAKDTAVKAPASKPPAETKAAPASGPLYYVQVGAFTDRAQAQTAAETYRKQGYTVFVTDPKPTDTRTWYRVRLGGYASRDRANSLLDKLNAAAGKRTDFRIVQD